LSGAAAATGHYAVRSAKISLFTGCFCIFSESSVFLFARLGLHKHFHQFDTIPLTFRTECRVFQSAGVRPTELRYSTP